jgi:uncharacterized protein with ParB-like and HNH nuclease domain
MLEIRELSYNSQLYSWLELWERLEANKIILEPLFERDNWSVRKKSRFIESIFLGLPMSPFYFDGTENNNWLIVDGRKRLKAFYDFMNNDFELKDLEFGYFKDTEGKRYKDLTLYYKLKFKEQRIKCWTLGSHSQRPYRELFFRKFSTYSDKKIKSILYYEKNENN